MLIVPALVMGNPEAVTSPVPAVMLVTVPPVAPQPASRNEFTAAGVLRVAALGPASARFRAYP